MKKYNRFSPRASLSLVGKITRQKELWRPIREQVKIPQKMRGHDPIDKLMDAWITILCGGHGVVEVNTRLRSDPGVQKTFGRSGCAEQSSVSRTLDACQQEQVQQMREALQTIFRAHSRAYQHDYQQEYQWLEVDMTGLLAGEHAQGSTKGYFPGGKRKRGRQVGRVLATRYNEIPVEKLYQGGVQLERSLQELVQMSEQVLELDEVRRKRIILRVDGGGGRDADINWELQRGYWILCKVKNWKRTQSLVARVQTWLPDRKDPKRQLGWVEPGFEYVRPTRQIGVRESRPSGKVYQYVVVTNLTDEMIFHESGLAFPPDASPAQLLSLAQGLYDQRSGGVETSNRNSKSGLGLNKRNKGRFDSQEMLLLLAQLAYNLLSWVHRLLAAPGSPFHRYGWQRIVRDLVQIPGRLVLAEDHRLIAVQLSRDHPLSKPFLQALLVSGVINDLSVTLRKI